MIKNFVFLTFLLSTFSTFATESALLATNKITGKYKGKWTMFGLTNGVVEKKISWSDVITAENPTEEKGLAFVNVTDSMVYEDGTNRISKFQEGYFVKDDGSVGERFYEISGSKVIFKKLTENDWTFQSIPSDIELSYLGVDPATVISKSHVTTKTTTYEGLIDTDHVTRITTIAWKDKDLGTTKSVQFVSLSGYHTRIK